jgi:hypothetical protein
LVAPSVDGFSEPSLSSKERSKSSFERRVSPLCLSVQSFQLEISCAFGGF